MRRSWKEKVNGLKRDQKRSMGVGMKWGAVVHTAEFFLCKERCKIEGEQAAGGIFEQFSQI